MGGLPEDKEPKSILKHSEIKLEDDCRGEERDKKGFSFCMDSNKPALSQQRQ